MASGRPAKVFGSHGQDGASAVACFRMCQALACRSFLTMLSHGCTTASLQTYGAAGEAKFGLEDSLKKFVLLMVRSLFCSSHASHIIYSVVLLRSWHDSCAAGSLRRRTSKVGGCSRRLISLASLATERLVATLPARSRECCLSLCAGTSTAPTARKASTLTRLLFGVVCVRRHFRQHHRGCRGVSLRNRLSRFCMLCVSRDVRGSEVPRDSRSCAATWHLRRTAPRYLEHVR